MLYFNLLLLLLLVSNNCGCNNGIGDNNGCCSVDNDDVDDDVDIGDDAPTSELLLLLGLQRFPYTSRQSQSTAQLSTKNAAILVR